MRIGKRYFVSALSTLAVLAIALSGIELRDVHAATHSSQPVLHAGGTQAARNDDRDPAALLEDYRHVEVASVSDAIEQLLGQRMYLSHELQQLDFKEHSMYPLIEKTKSILEAVKQFGRL